MQSLLNDFLTNFFFVYLVVFIRFGTALMMMPGIGDAFVPARVRLFFALGLCLVVTPMLSSQIGSIPSSAIGLSILLTKEALVGFFIGIISRTMMSALSVAGMVISMQSGLSSALVFNPTFSGQGSVLGALLSVTGVVLLFATNLHHMLIMAIFNSYTVFPFGSTTIDGDFADVMARVVSDSFRVGVQFAAPFIILSLIIYLGIGVMARLMPQLQIFFIILPMQIWISFVLFLVTISGGMMYFLGYFDSTLATLFLTGA